MKNLNFTKFAIFSFLLVVITSLVALNTNLKAEEKSKPNEDKCKISIQIQTYLDKDMIEKELKNKEGVKDAYVDMDEKMTYVTYDKTKIKADRLVKTIQDLGFDAKLVEERSMTTK